MADPMDTMELRELRKMIENAPEKGAYELDDILAEFSDRPAPPAAKPPASRRETPAEQPAQMKPQPEPAARPAAPRRETPAAPAAKSKEEPAPSRPAPPAADRSVPERTPGPRRETAAERPAAQPAPAADSDQTGAAGPELLNWKTPARDKKKSPDPERVGQDAPASAPAPGRRINLAAHAAQRGKARQTVGSTGPLTAPPPSPRPRTRPEGKNEIGDLDQLDRTLAEDDGPEQTAPEPEPREEEIIHNPRAAASAYHRRARSMGKRSLLVGVLWLAALYFGLAGEFPALPQALQRPLWMREYALPVLQGVALLASLDVVLRGLVQLFTLRASFASLAALLALVTEAHAVALLLWPELAVGGSYIPLSLGALYFALRGQRSRYAALQRTYKAVLLSDRPRAVYCHAGEPPMAVKSGLEENEEFLKQIERPDGGQRFARVYVPLAVVLALAFALMGSLGRGRAEQFLWIFSGVLSAAMPFALAVAYDTPLSHTVRRLLGEGAALAGGNCAAALSRCRQIALSDEDLFFAGSIEVEAMKVYGRFSTETVLSYAAALTEAGGLEVGRVFAQLLKERYGRPQRADQVKHYESGGLSGNIYGHAVSLGTQAFLMRTGVSIYDGRHLKNGVYLAIDGQLAGIFALKYYPTAPVYGALNSLLRHRIRPLLAVRDFNLTPAMVESLFELKRGFSLYPDVGTRLEVSSAEYVRGDMACALLSRDSVASFVSCLLRTSRLVKSTRANLTICTAAGVCGMLLMFYLAWCGSVAAASPAHLFFYSLLWSVPVWYISRHTKKE